ncbi:MAG: response regulator, partial [Coleofasciculaceae cyanobacterium]
MSPQEIIPIRPKLLVVDDEPDNLDLLYRTFHRDYRVLRAENGPEALEILANEQDVAVIISDQRMPLMSGTEFLSLTANKYPDIIRIILTGYTDVEDLVDAINAGKVFKFVTKPWNADELKAVVSQAMETHNVLKVRTEELSRALRRESLLNTVTNTIRNAQYGLSGGSPLQQILRKIVATVGHLLEADICILRPFQDDRLLAESFVYQKNQESTGENQPTPSQPAFYPPALEQTLWETREVEVINDVLTSDRFDQIAAAPQQAQSQETARLRAYQQLNIRSSLIVPLISQQELMAVMALHRCGEPYLWGNDEIQLVVMVADQAALALSQARAYEQVQALATQQALINTITTAIRSTLNPEEIFTAITQQLGQALKVDGCVLSLWKAEDEFVQCVGLYDGRSGQAMGTETVIDDRRHAVLPPKQLPQSIVPISGNPVLQQLLTTQQPVVIDDLVVNSQLNGFDLPLRELSSALIVVPLLSDGQLIGSITLRQTSKPRHWLTSEIDLAQAVASQAAIAVQQSRLYQKTRQQAERLLELDRQRTEFFQNISHEFRTPLTLMIGPLESVVGAKKPLPYDQSVIALRNSRRLLRLVNQLLDLQRLDAGRMQASFHPYNFVEFINQIIENFRPYCDRKNITISTQLTAGAAVYLDEKFDKVLYNLLSNAMKFTNPGGSITIIVEPVGDHLRMLVTDTGIGIRQEQIPYLFERFRQAEGSVNRSHEGTGLGLALAKELVELHGGEISVESVYSEGTTFSVLLKTGYAHLPSEQVMQVSTEIQPSRASVEWADRELESGLDIIASPEEDVAIEILDQVDTGVSNGDIDAATIALNSTLTVEVVDDNSDVRSYISRILRQVGYQVIMAKNGQEGFEVALEHCPDLIVTDLMMPMVSGIDLIRRIRNLEELKGTPIILVTAKADETTRLEGAQEGADGYLSKPFSDEELLAGVRNLLSLKASERQLIDLNQQLIESKRFLTESVLKRFLPPSMVERAATGELSLKLSPEPRLITILFSDIVGFTRLSNTLRSRRIAELLNEYLETMTRIVFDHGGTVDKFMGDAILVLFGAPEELTPNEQVRRAIATAREMYRALELLNERWKALGIVGGDNNPLVQFRCGIHQGAAVVGMFGSDERSDYTAIGPAVNIASRLQEAAKPNSILISAAVAEYLEDDAITKNEQPLTLRGIDETVLTFSVNSTISDRP